MAPRLCRRGAVASLPQDVVPPVLASCADATQRVPTAPEARAASSRVAAGAGTSVSLSLAERQVDHENGAASCPSPAFRRGGLFSGSSPPMPISSPSSSSPQIVACSKPRCYVPRKKSEHGGELPNHARSASLGTACRHRVPEATSRQSATPSRPNGRRFEN